MFGNILSRLFGTKGSRTLKKLQPIVDQINALEERHQRLDDADFPKQTALLRDRLTQGESLDSLLPEAFSLVRAAGVRTLGQRHYDVQLVGGIVLHQGHIAEMRTGEGKTLVATLSAYLNALPCEGVHVVTVNDYLAERDAAWMRPLYEFLGLSVGVVVSNQSQQEKRLAYQADITYGTNNEFGFDYLRDNMAFSTDDILQRSNHYAIVDEVDSILIDEARTPLIISGASEENSQLYTKINKLVYGLEAHTVAEEKALPLDKSYLSEDEIEAQGHYVLDEKNRSIDLTEKGHRVFEDRLREVGLLDAQGNLYSANNLDLLHHLQAALKAQILFRRDVDYLVRDGEVMIVDEHTGRVMPGRRWSDGIHQAIEAKEGLSIQSETQTLASTTFQNYFRLYDKLAGMTGTADTEAFEFKHIYNLDVVVIPTNKPMARSDMNDLVYMTENEKYEAIIEDVQDAVEQGRPILVGTTSVESSERLSRAMNKQKLEHMVLNAKHHQQEAVVIAQAGKSGAITIATNMAGRGTDIILGGNWEAGLSDKVSQQEAEEKKSQWQADRDAIVAAGGLHIIGTERHESRRIDNQLRGRAGRQGDPGSSRFYLSLEDNLMRIFASDRIRAIMQRLGVESGEAIEHRMVTNAIEKAQRKVEGRNFDIRKNLLDYDNVANSQRQVIYAQRQELMQAQDISDTITELREAVLMETVYAYIPPQSLYEQWDVAGLGQALSMDFSSTQPLAQWLEADEGMTDERLAERILQQVDSEYQQKETLIGAPQMRMLEKTVMLMALDQLWKEHLAIMGHLREGIALRAYAQKQPKQEYKREAFELFQKLLDNIRYRTIHNLSKVQVQQNDDFLTMEEEQRKKTQLLQSQNRASKEQFPSDPLSGQPALPRTRAPEPPQASTSPTRPFTRGGRKIGRNEPCPCGSGKKYKHCHYQTGL